MCECVCVKNKSKERNYRGLRLTRLEQLKTRNARERETEQIEESDDCGSFSDFCGAICKISGVACGSDKEGKQREAIRKDTMT